VEIAALRILDANLNRCREALRTMEDHARLGLNDAGLAADLKGLRHDLAGATADLATKAVAHRDTPGDVGTSMTTTSEATRESLAAVAVAAGKRAGEAMRVIEEVTKTLDGHVAAVVKQLRYRLYEHERSLLARSRPRGVFDKVRVYVLITESVCRGDWRWTAEQAIDGGADCLQLREPELPAGELLGRATWLVDLCRSRNVISIINDRPDIAMLSGADGVHVGQGDLPVRDVRRLIGPDKVIGVSTHGAEQLKSAWQAGADYVGVGPVFPSPTKPRDILPGLAYAKEAAWMDLLPTVAIAGITPDNVGEVWSTGVTAVAATSCVTRAEDPAAATVGLRLA
jgi:thiamine-phosphate pyrophosphorylase